MQRRQRAGVEERVGQADLPELRRTPSRISTPATASPRPPITVWFSAMTTRRPARAPSARIVAVVERLDRRHVEHGRVDASAASASAASSARMVISPVEMNSTSAPSRSSFALPISKRVAVLVEHQRHLAAQQPHVDRAVVGGDRRQCLRDLGRVAGIDDRQVGMARNSARSSIAWWVPP